MWPKLQFDFTGDVAGIRFLAPDLGHFTFVQVKDSQVVSLQVPHQLLQLVQVDRHGVLLSVGVVGSLVFNQLLIVTDFISNPTRASASLTCLDCEMSFPVYHKPDRMSKVMPYINTK